MHTPSLNTKVFKHKVINWEWGLSSGAVVIFTVGMEMWKRWWGSFTRDGEMRSEWLGVGEGPLSLMRSFCKMRTESDLYEEVGLVDCLEMEVKWVIILD